MLISEKYYRNTDIKYKFRWKGKEFFYLKKKKTWTACRLMRIVYLILAARSILCLSKLKIDFEFEPPATLFLLFIKI